MLNRRAAAIQGLLFPLVRYLDRNNNVIDGNRRPRASNERARVLFTVKTCRQYISCIFIKHMYGITRKLQFSLHNPRARAHNHIKTARSRLHIYKRRFPHSLPRITP